jgi:hypothetical protein
LTFTTFDIVDLFSFSFPTLFPFFSSLLHLINSYEITRDFLTPDLIQCFHQTTYILIPY